MNGLNEVSNIIDESCTRMDKNCKKLQKIKTEFNKWLIKIKKYDII